MADPCQPCSCIPYENICCCGPSSGITVIQPACQVLADGRIANNPCFCTEKQLPVSCWTYKFITDCAQGTKGISSFVIPVCENIIEDYIKVFERIDGCSSFQSIPFSLSKTDPNFGTAPAGYVFLKVETSNRYDVGVCVEYRLQLNGNFPVTVQPIKVKAGKKIITFNCGCFFVPGCPATGKLEVIKTCIERIIDNVVTLSYNIVVSNTGNATLDNVIYQDEIIFNASSLTLGSFTVTPTTLSVTTPSPGRILISGNLGSIAPGGFVTVTYDIPVTDILTPGTLTVTNTTTATATDTQATQLCTLNIEAVKIEASKCCSVSNNNQVTYTLNLRSAGTSPSTVVNVTDQLIIPAGVTVRFTDFGGCTATFAGTGNPVPLNTDITGAKTIDILCNLLTIPTGVIIPKNIKFVVSSVTEFDAPVVISNTVQNITLAVPGEQVLLGVDGIPATADVTVTAALQCQNPCSP